MDPFHYIIHWIYCNRIVSLCNGPNSLCSACIPLIIESGTYVLFLYLGLNEAKCWVSMNKKVSNWFFCESCFLDFFDNFHNAHCGNQFSIEEEFHCLLWTHHLTTFESQPELKDLSKCNNIQIISFPLVPIWQ
jgi:hypothetical protein